MSQRCRIAASKLRRRYATVFGVSLELVTVEERPGDDATVRCPSRPELPVWTTGPLPGSEPELPIRSRRR